MPDLSITKEEEKQLSDLEKVAREASVATTGETSLARGMKVADAMQTMRESLTQKQVQRLMSLQGSRLGFRTDKDRNGGYPADVVKDCAIEGLLRGVFPVGNELNIIAGNCYITKEGYQGLLKRMEGLADLRKTIGHPKVKRGQQGKVAAVPCSASWTYKGTEDELECEPTVRVNKRMGIDAIKGKAERRLLKKVYERITGSEQPDGSVDDPDVIDVDASVSEPQNQEGSISMDDLSGGEATEMDAMKQEAREAFDGDSADPEAEQDEAGEAEEGLSFDKLAEDLNAHYGLRSVPKRVKKLFSGGYADFEGEVPRLHDLHRAIRQQGEGILDVPGWGQKAYDKWLERMDGSENAEGVPEAEEETFTIGKDTQITILDPEDRERDGARHKVAVVQKDGKKRAVWFDLNSRDYDCTCKLYATKGRCGHVRAVRNRL